MERQKERDSPKASQPAKRIPTAPQLFQGIPYRVRLRAKRLAPSKGSAISVSPARAISVWELGNTSVRRIENPRRDPSALKVLTEILRPSSNHFWKSEKASLDEITFIGCAETYGLDIATRLAAEFRWKCRRALRALRRND